MVDERKAPDPGAGKPQPERYPQADRTDAVEPRSFDPSACKPGDDGEPHTRGEDHLGPAGDPAEGKPDVE